MAVFFPYFSAGRVMVVVTVVVLGLACCGAVESSGSSISGVYVKENNKQTCLGPAPTTSTTTTVTDSTTPTTRRAVRGVITTPDRPGQVNCQWEIVNPHQETLLLSFTQFDLRAGCCDGDPRKCCYQWVSLSSDTPGGKRGDKGGKRGWWKRGHRHNAFTPHHYSTLPHHNTFFSHQSSINLSHNNCNAEGDGGDVMGAGRVCGAALPRPMVTQAPRVLVTYHSSLSVDVKSLSSPLSPIAAAAASAGAQSGFRMVFYTVSNRSLCGPNEFTCTTPHLCVPLTLWCDGQVHCPDYSDEDTCEGQQKRQQKNKEAGSCLQEATTVQCDGAWQCPNGEDEKGCPGCGDDQWWCGMGRECYNKAQRCDGTAHCSNSMDELSCNPACHRRVSCWSGGCYLLSQRCDGSPDCSDASDEANCSPALCNEQHGTFLCNNHRCIRQTWQCNQLDDCRDGSDEQDCLRNSVIGVAAMGGLACSLLLVVAVGCTGRLYALRMGLTRMQGSVSGGHRGGEGRGSTAPRSRLEEHLLQREMPPPYDVAVNDRSTPLFGTCGDWQQWRRQRRRSSVPQERGNSPLRAPVYGGAPPLDPHHQPSTQGLTVEIRCVGREGPEKMEEGAGESAFFATHEGDVPLLTALVVDGCLEGGEREDSDDVPLLLDLASTSTSSASSICEVDSDDEDLGSVCGGSERNEEMVGDVGKAATLPILPALLHLAPLLPPPTTHTHDKAMGVDGGIGPLDEMMGKGRNASSHSSSFFPKAGETLGDEVTGKGDCASPSPSSPFFAEAGGMLGDGAVGKGNCTSPFFPFPEGGEALGNAAGDVLLSDTRAAVLALSAVQSHMDEMTHSDTEMMCQPACQPGS